MDSPINLFSHVKKKSSTFDATLPWCVIDSQDGQQSVHLK
jgi:hypothetical protein